MCMCPLLVAFEVGSLSVSAPLLHIRTSCHFCLCLLSLSRNTRTKTAHSSTASSFFFLKCGYHGLNSGSQDCMACAFTTKPSCWPKLRQPFFFVPLIFCLWSFSYLETNTFILSLRFKMLVRNFHMNSKAMRMREHFMHSSLSVASAWLILPYVLLHFASLHQPVIL